MTNEREFTPEHYQKTLRLLNDLSLELPFMPPGKMFNPEMSIEAYERLYELKKRVDRLYDELAGQPDAAGEGES